MLSEYLDFATKMAYLAGKLTLGYFQTAVHTEIKSDNTPVTSADIAAEEFIRRQIENRFPQHAIIGEEFGVKENQSANFRWIIDPIDGTKSFVQGVPLYAVLIGLEIEGKVEVGAAYFPALDEMINAATGLGCWWNGRRASVSPVSDLRKAVVTCTTTQHFRHFGRQDCLDRVMQTCRFLAGWGDAYGYALVATGRAELMLDPAMHVWDCGPFPPILSEAGGYFGDWQGNPTIYAGEALGTSQVLLPQVLALIRGEETFSQT